ncbi:MAG: substrate-binding domain-containing protein [Alphaproteobacteria bacterium]
MVPYIRAAVAHFSAKQRDVVAPVVATRGSTSGIKEFCDGIGVDLPDIVASSRRMSRAEAKTCAVNKVTEVIEIVIGYGAVVVVARRGTEPFNLIPEHMYRALALEVPDGGEFKTNPNLKWRDIHHSLPDTEINIFAPSGNSGTRSVFDDRIMQAGCRYIPEIRTVYAAADRTARCTTPRADGRFTEVDETIGPLDILRKAPVGAMAVIDRAQWIDEARGLVVFPVNGLLPTEQSIANDEYPLSRRLYFYFKKGHMRDRKGFGVARGLREFMTSVTSDEAMEPGGYFERKGVIVLSREERARQRLEAISLTPMER